MKRTREDKEFDFDCSSTVFNAQPVAALFSSLNSSSSSSKEEIFSDSNSITTLKPDSEVVLLGTVKREGKYTLRASLVLVLNLSLNNNHPPPVCHSDSTQSLQQHEEQPQQQLFQLSPLTIAEILKGTRFIDRNWHFQEQHREFRELIVMEIVEFLHSKNPNAPLAWQLKVPRLAKKLDDILYCEASTFEEYNDTSTLRARMKRLAFAMKGWCWETPSTTA